ncbi:hypothetical protein JOY44_30250 (plasmid) [Phormidium sp. CLA17]|uniref:hypothetical protein n=1 Tax=Leptolyngbya sp. Cla-17 TaxID=2803751 RepID=UPI001490D8C5|nr:hypothetical protein [Leptolyngbya sp. Cla-17]MBM0745700.1 hypothetical protein [Leptolyngbya sp. Cla-17]
MTLPLIPSFKGFGAKLQPKRSHPSPQFQSVAEGEDAFLALFSHRHDYIWAEHPQPTTKPEWQTESRHPLSDRLVLQGSSLYGVRFGPKTNYLLFDIDSGSLYHPRRDPFAIARLVAALEVLGLVSYIAVTSSYSGGLHLYFPFERVQKSYELAGAVQALLENAGFVFSPGQLELFPNDRGFVDGKPTLYAAHRLPLQLGSYLLNHDWETIFSTPAEFVHQWQFCLRRNPVTSRALKQVLKAAKRRRFSLSGKVDKFLNDLNAEIEPGWSGTGQTNRILGRIALRTYIFAKILYGHCLEGKALVEKMVEIATALPGYRDHCQHQHEIRHRVEEWAQSVETTTRYFPYKGRRAKPNRSSKPAETPSWHEQQLEDARGRISRAIALMLESNALSIGATARFRALTEGGIGGATLYRHKDLWHPEYLMPVDFGVRSSAEAHSKSTQSNDTPPHPPGLNIEREEDAPKCPSLLALKSSNTPSGKHLSGARDVNVQAISSNTQAKGTGVEFVKQKLAEVEQVQAYQRAAQLELWQQYEQKGGQVTHPSPARVDKMRRWLESGDAILVAEAEVFFSLMQTTLRGGESGLEDGHNSHD